MKTTNFVAALALVLVSSSAAAGAIYRCQHEGRTVFSDQPCESGINRGAAATRPQAQRESLQVAGTTADAVALRTAQVQDAGRQARCRDLNDEVKYIDTQARQPNAPSYLEYLKDRRRNITDRIASLKCETL